MQTALGHTLAQFCRARALIGEAHAVEFWFCCRDGGCQLLHLGAQPLGDEKPDQHCCQGQPSHPTRVQRSGDISAGRNPLYPDI